MTINVQSKTLSLVTHTRDNVSVHVGNYGYNYLLVQLM
jgi:hypothetical protein